MGEIKDDDIRKGIKVEMLKHIEATMDDFPFWEVKFRLEDWDFEDEIDQAKTIALLEALYDVILETQPNLIEITLKYAVAISKEDPQKGDDMYL